jgi:hypothetical protein
MTTTIILSQILGIIVTVFGLSVLVNKKSIIALLDDTKASQGVLWMLGFITLLLGALMVVFHTNWNPGLPTFVTILGWLTLAKGVITLVFPEYTRSKYQKWVGQKSILTTGIITLGIGLLFLYFGFI